MAERLLKENKLTIGEIALQIGYQNPNKFTSAFRTEYGMTPTAVSYTHLDVYKRQDKIWLINQIKVIY